MEVSRRRSRTSARERHSSTTGSSNAAAVNVDRSRGTTPASSFERSRSCSTSLPSRSTCCSIASSAGRSTGSTPSTMFSSFARSAPIGVLSSCETFATRSRLSRSTSASCVAIVVNACASSPTSSLDVAVTRRL